MHFQRFLAIILTLIIVPLQAGAGVILQTENDGTQEDVWYIDRDNNSTGNVSLSFGNNLSATLEYDTVADLFRVSKDVDMTQNEIQNMVVHSGVTFPATPVAGQLFYKSDEGKLYHYDGTIWKNDSATGSGDLEQYTFTLNPESVHTITHSTDPLQMRIIQLYAEQIGGTEVGGSMTPYDPNNYSTIEQNINDGTVTSIWFNNTSSGPVGKWAGLDNGSSTNVDSFKIYDYQTSSVYMCPGFDFDYSNDGSTWTTAMSIASHTHSPNGAEYTLPTTINAQYFRVACTASSNGSWWVVAELELYQAATGSTKMKLEDTDVNIEYIDTTQTKVTNETSTTYSVYANILIP